MAKTFIHGFFPNYKLHKACGADELRPVQGYLYFKDGNVYATDSYMAIAAPLSFVSNFDDDEKHLLEGRLIHATQFAHLLKMRETHVKVSADGVRFECKTAYGETIIFPLLTEEQIGKFPNVKSVLVEAEENAKKGAQLPRVGFKPSLLADLVAAMDAKIIEFYFAKPAGAIVLRSEDETNEIHAILMPCMIGDPKF